MFAQAAGMRTKFYSSMCSWVTRKPKALLAVAGWLALSAAGWAASPSELLEQGIYAEETKGDLDAATNAYRQAIAEARPGWAAAAQAQFRLGVCCYKKKDFASGAAAFDQVIENHPEEKELVAQANDYLYRALPLLPAPWVDGEELQFVIKASGGEKGASMSFAVNAGETNGQKFWRIELLFANSFQSMMAHVTEVDAATFRPLRSRVKSWGRCWGTDYEPGHAESWATGVEGVKKLDLTGAVYDDDTTLYMVRRLPLATNYEARVMIAELNPSVGERAPSRQAFRMTGVESVTVPAGTYECYKVEFGPKTTVWYSTDLHRYLVKFADTRTAVIDGRTVGGDVRVELSAVTRCPAGEPALYRDAALGFSLTAPAGWRIVRHSGEEMSAALSTGTQDHDRMFNSFCDSPKAQTVLCFLDPDVTCSCVADVGPLASLNEGERQSLHTWAKEDMARSTKGSHYFDGQTNDWQELTIAGQPAVSVAVRGLPVGTSDSSQTLYGVWTFDNTNAVKFYSMMPTKSFGNARPTVEAIARSYTPAR
jgi:hypothetical protein